MDTVIGSMRYFDVGGMNAEDLGVMDRNEGGGQS